MVRIEVTLRRGSGCGAQRVLYQQCPSRSAQKLSLASCFMFGNRLEQIAKYFAWEADQRVAQLLQRSHSHRGERIGEASHPGPSKWRSIPLHTWDQDGSELKNGFALLSSDPARVCKMLAATEVESWREATVAALRATFDNVVHQKVQTCGDGKCAIHARFGAPTSHGEMKVSNIDQFIFRNIQDSYDHASLYTHIYKALDSEGRFLNESTQLVHVCAYVFLE